MDGRTLASGPHGQRRPRATASPDPLAVLTVLGVADIISATPVEGGRDTAIWRIGRRGGSCVLRMFRREQAATFGREFAAMDAASAAGIPVPAVQANAIWLNRLTVGLIWCGGRQLAPARITSVALCGELLAGRAENHGLCTLRAPTYAPNSVAPSL
jgi:hypothetical protein